MVVKHSSKYMGLVRLILITVTSFSLSTALQGCISAGQEFAASRVGDIVIGETSQRDIRDIFGEPWRVGIEDGKRTWTYGKYAYSLFGPDETEDLVIRFDDQGIVRSFTFNTTRK